MTKVIFRYRHTRNFAPRYAINKHFHTNQTQHTMKKIVFATLTGLLSAGLASAQIRIAPELGLNLASVSGKNGGESMSSGMKIGGRVGAIVEFGLTKNIYLRPGLQYSMLGGKNGDLNEGMDVDVTETINYLQVPVNVLYKLGNPGEGRFYVGLVPYVGFALSGKGKIDDKSFDLEIGSDKDKDDLKPLDFGAGIKVGYEMPMGLYVDASYMLGLTNNLPGGDADNKMSNRNITIGVGYFLFGGEKK
jgi:opacity protein-like surface antigen